MNADRDRDADERRLHVEQIARLAVDVPDDEDRDGDGNRRERGPRPACCEGGPGGAPWGPIRRRDGRRRRFSCLLAGASRALRRTSSVPTLPGASSDVAISVGATMCTAPTPAASGANASSSFGIMPPCTVPSAIAAFASATVSRGSRVAGSSLSRRTPPTAVQATSAPAPHRRRELAGDDVGVDVQDGAARVGAQAGDHGQRVARVERVEQLDVEAVDVADQTEVDRRVARARSRRAADGGGRGSRRSRPTRRTRARRRRAAPRPDRRSASRRRSSSRSSSIGSSVTRRPPTMRDSMPRRRASAVACGPPPCTTSSRRPARARAISAAASASASPSSTSPPSLMTASTGRAIGRATATDRDPRATSVSGTPSIRFMFWIACPAPPLIRLSVALTIASVHVRRPSPPAGAPSVKPTSA